MNRIGQRWTGAWARTDAALPDNAINARRQPCDRTMKWMKRCNITAGVLVPRFVSRYSNHSYEHRNGYADFIVTCGSTRADLEIALAHDPRA